MQNEQPKKQQVAGGGSVPCPVCGTANAPDRKECSECGFIFEKAQESAVAPANSRECPSCGAVLEASDSDCPICGEKLMPAEVK